MLYLGEMQWLLLLFIDIIDFTIYNEKYVNN